MTFCVALQRGRFVVLTSYLCMPRPLQSSVSSEARRSRQILSFCRFQHLQQYLRIFVKKIMDHWAKPEDDNLKATSKNVIPAKAGIQKSLTSLDSRRSLPRT